MCGSAVCPRLCVHRSLKNIFASIIDDGAHKTLFSMSTMDKGLKAKLKSGGNVQAATALGTAFAAKIIEKGVKKVSFDRGGYLYHGRVKAFAEAVRKGGVEL